MPELTPQSTPPDSDPLPPVDFPPPPPPDRVMVKEWEQWEGFRFTFLRHFPRPEDTEALRGVAQLLYDLVLDSPPSDWPQLPGPDTFWELVAAHAELRFLEGFLTSVFEEHRASSLPPEVEELSKYAGGIAYDLSEISDRITEKLAQFREATEGRKGGSWPR
jgi:hypothetical protein